MFYVRLRGANVGLSSLVISPFALGIAFGSIIYGRLIRRTMRYKKLSIVGLGTIVASFAVLALIWRSSASYLSLIPVFLVGTGMAGLFTTQFVALSARSRGGHARATITAYYLAQQLGLIIGVTTSAKIVRTLFANDLRRTLHGLSQLDELIQRILNNNRFAESLPETIQSHVRQSFQHSFRAIPDYRNPPTIFVILSTLGDTRKE
ncbi:Major facilitator superfamily domain general substrate transporter [Penicillium mononematosum]|uniref:Major facilitator superfamily domain general substrate transporter n=1 Tax=Penicillium mononematosum TaxID=268346 RepID=UPI002547A6EB|nr:Major facilitator superfamily domain general substrate transporter [Penicillium mononematosum]KAJ6187600.1 Major facilitator superfamily domain general substrate transporter [Penicillium mononematosum]